MNTGIYKITNQIDKKCYVGSAINLRKRKTDHCSKLIINKHFNQKLQRAYNKHGKENFEFSILLYCDKKDLLFYEQRAIDAFDKKCLYNICPTAGNMLGYKQSDETKYKKSESCKKTMSTPESIEKRSKLKTGFKHSSESILKMRESHIGKTMSSETKLKMSKAHIGKSKSKTHIENMVKAKSGNKNPLYKHFTDSQLKEIKELRDSGLSYHKISQFFNCWHSTIILKLKEYNENLI